MSKNRGIVAVITALFAKVQVTGQDRLGPSSEGDSSSVDTYRLELGGEQTEDSQELIGKRKKKKLK